MELRPQTKTTSVDRFLIIVLGEDRTTTLSSMQPSLTLASLLITFTRFIPVLGLSSASTRRSNTFVLQPWSSNEALGQARAVYTDSLLEVTVTSPDAVETVVHVPIPEEEGNLASSLWPASCAAAVWWNKYGAALLTDYDYTKKEKTDQSLRILELGSGLGVTGWMAGVVASRQEELDVSLVLSDQDEQALERLASSAKHNPDTSSRLHVETRRLDWRDEHDKESEERFDLVVGSDLAYYGFLLGPLADTIETFGKKALVVLVSPTKRQSLWELYHLMRDGGYNVKTDVRGSPWPGTIRMLLFRLHCLDDGSTSPMAVLCWTSNTSFKRRLEYLIETEDLHIVTKEDEERIEKSF